MVILNMLMQEAINPALKLLPARMNSDSARVMLLAIGLQESRFESRFQIVSRNPLVKGPARSYWQFERPGGVRGVMKHPTTKQNCIELCKARRVAFDEFAIHEAMERDDILSAGMARLFLYTDSKPLPGMDAKPQEGWDTYFRVWKPGKPHRDSWNAYYLQAKGQVLA